MINVYSHLEDSCYDELQKKWVVAKGDSGSRKVFCLFCFVF